MLKIDIQAILWVYKTTALVVPYIILSLRNYE